MERKCRRTTCIQNKGPSLPTDGRNLLKYTILRKPQPLKYLKSAFGLLDSNLPFTGDAAEDR
jgi:hypothetical protein